MVLPVWWLLQSQCFQLLYETYEVKLSSELSQAVNDLDGTLSRA